MTDLFGRNTELTELLEAVSQLNDTDPGVRLVEVVGEPGIGKTALLSELARIIREAGTTLLFGRAAWDSRSQPFSTFSDAFEEHYELACAAMSAMHPHGCAELATMFPTMARCCGVSYTQPSPSVTQPGQRAVRQLFEHLAADKLVLVLDNMHAADLGSLDLLASLLRRPPSAAVLIVLGYRDRQVCTKLRLAIAGRSRQVPTTQIRLGPLSESDTELMLAGHHTGTWPKDLHQESRGNPSYLTALRAERLANMTPHDPARPATNAEYATFLHDLEGLSAEAAAAAEAAAVIGYEFDAALVAELTGRTALVAFGAIGELIDRGVAVAAARRRDFAFRHPVVRRAVYSATELSRRVQMHAHVDRALRARRASDVERAPHVAQYASYGDMDAVGVLTRASQKVAPTRPDTASNWLAAAIRVLPRHSAFQEQRARLLVLLAKTRGAAGSLCECRDTMHEALTILPAQPAAEHASAVAFTAMTQRLLGTHAEAGAMLRAEIEALGSHDSLARAELSFEAACRHLTAGEWAACRTEAAEALAIARRHDSRTLQASCLGLRAMAAAIGGHTSVAAGYLGEATAILDGMLDVEFAQSLDAAVWIGKSEILLERWDDAARHFDKAVTAARRTRNLLTLPHLLAGQVFVLRHRGQLTEALTAAEHAVHVARQAGSPEQMVSAYSMRSWVEVTLGRLDEAAESAGFATAQIREAAPNWRDALALRMLGEVRLSTGDPDGCVALIATAGGPNLCTADPVGKVAWYELLTRAELVAGRIDAAAKWAELATAAAALLDQPGRAALAGLARVHLLLASDPASALTEARQAAVGLELAGMTVDALRARVALGVALWHQDRFEDAIRELKGAELAFAALGAVPLSRMARTERRRLCARARRGKGTDPEGTVLTSREQQVADLVGQGLTNRMIGRRLHIAEKTVEMHLSSVFAKLGLSSRAAVAAFVTRSVANSST